MPHGLTELLHSFVRCREDYPNLPQSDVSEALVSDTAESETLVHNAYQTLDDCF